MEKIRVAIWNEFRHEKKKPEVAELYPNGLHAKIAEFLGECDDIETTLAALDDPDHETFKSFYNPYVQRIIKNAVHWVVPNEIGYELEDKCPHITTKVTDEFGE